MSTTTTIKPIRSFVKRARGMTAAKKNRIDTVYPKFGLKVEQGQLDFTTIFQRQAPVTLEIGFGNGDTLIALASKYLEEDFIGIEVHQPGISNILANIEKNKLSNIRIFNADAVEVITKCIPDHSIDRILIFFPDPWPKKRHHKRRLVQIPFITLLQQKLKHNGILHIATDWENYALHVLEVMQNFPDLINIAGKDQFTPRPEYRPLTKFEKRGQKLGHKIYDLIFTLAKTSI